ncbi:MAG: rhomboid family intrarane serine protease [Ferruginibacter sp.]|nr:rhomboid family intrarane serine protease [Ferruginibacter sp.]
MGESDRYQEYRQPKPRFRLRFGDDNNALMAIFTLNVVFFLTLKLIEVIYYFYDQSSGDFNHGVVEWFALPANLTKLSERPWTILTFMFSENGTNMGNILRLAGNMLWLWAFGSLLQRMTGNDKILPVYIYGGVLGGIVFIIANYSIPALAPTLPTASLIGANAATMAVATATTTLHPNFKFFQQIRGGIPIWVLLAVYILIDLAGIAGLGHPAAAHSLSHLGGALAGYLFIVLLRKGKDGSLWMNRLYHWFMNLFNPNKKGHDTSLKEKIFYDTGNRAPYSKKSIITQQRVDEILDKINQRGYHFLTDEEKEILKKAAEEDL